MEKSVCPLQLLPASSVTCIIISNWDLVHEIEFGGCCSLCKRLHWQTVQSFLPVVRARRSRAKTRSGTSRRPSSSASAPQNTETKGIMLLYRSSKVSVIIISGIFTMMSVALGWTSRTVSGGRSSNHCLIGRFERIHNFRMNYEITDYMGNTHWFQNLYQKNSSIWILLLHLLKRSIC